MIINTHLKKNLNKAIFGLFLPNFRGKKKRIFLQKGKGLNAEKGKNLNGKRMKASLENW